MLRALSGSRFGRFLLPFIFLVGSLGTPLLGNDELRGLEERLVSLFAENQSAMVRVKAVYPSKNKAEGEEVPQVVIGTGFFISREGLIITNASIVYQPLRVWIEHDQIAYSAEVLGVDERTNIAFLRTHSLPSNFSFFHLTDRPDLPPVGSFILRLSMPLEFSASPSFGMVSGFESRFGERFFPCTYVRTTIPAGPGDGGSAYVDLTGRLLGIQVGSLPDVASSYILPARAALRIRDDILFSGQVTYGWIGFEVDIETSIENGKQIVLNEIFEDSPAMKAGLIEGDILEQIGDYQIHSLDDLRNAMFYTRVGQYVDIRIVRDGEPRRMSVKMDARPKDEPMEIIESVEMDPAVDPLKEKPESANEQPMPFEKDFNQSPEEESAGAEDSVSGNPEPAS
ncbi:serine protease [Puniceicoccales bacterium CK1056]|uniref:Serine protease n=1 Tax=Oceanipulchritudo coccoides TaxID=2706888 RepID=A0A6B2LZZ7_9BACT|nr:S1C family serine protease [Oceanipulchritudo coccoides]NDV61347.1 serine protease [Oceanipulchritudo coccoides]